MWQKCTKGRNPDFRLNTIMWLSNLYLSGPISDGYIDLIAYWTGLRKLLLEISTSLSLMHIDLFRNYVTRFYPLLSDRIDGNRYNNHAPRQLGLH